jgi:plasmid maintenance system antidote protein VapI
MFADFEKYKGIHPGTVLERVLKKRHLGKRPFALSLPEHPQTLNAITKGKRDLNVALSLKIEHALGLEEGTLMTLQVFYDIKKEKEKNNSIPKPDLNKIRQVLFWDTDIQKIDWAKQYKFVIKRVFERGNDIEKEELLKFYGQEKIKEVTGSTSIIGNHITLMSHLNTR